MPHLSVGYPVSGLNSEVDGTSVLKSSVVVFGSNGGSTEHGKGWKMDHDGADVSATASTVVQPLMPGQDQ